MSPHDATVLLFAMLLLLFSSLAFALYQQRVGYRHGYQQAVKDLAASGPAQEETQ
jgi:hypothetical protein